MIFRQNELANFIFSINTFCLIRLVTWLEVLIEVVKDVGQGQIMSLIVTRAADLRELP